jgi:hypothetical protein
MDGLQNDLGEILVSISNSSGADSSGYALDLALRIEAVHDGLERIREYVHGVNIGRIRS